VFRADGRRDLATPTRSSPFRFGVSQGARRRPRERDAPRRRPVAPSLASSPWPRSFPRTGASKLSAGDVRVNKNRSESSTGGAPRARPLGSWRAPRPVPTPKGRGARPLRARTDALSPSRPAAGMPLPPAACRAPYRAPSRCSRPRPARKKTELARVMPSWGSWWSLCHLGTARFLLSEHLKRATTSNEPGRLGWQRHLLSACLSSRRIDGAYAENGKHIPSICKDDIA
jgi:hypothetical protein